MCLNSPLCESSTRRVDCCCAMMMLMFVACSVSLTKFSWQIEFALFYSIKNSTPNDDRILCWVFKFAFRMNVKKFISLFRIRILWIYICNKCTFTCPHFVWKSRIAINIQNDFRLKLHSKNHKIQFNAICAKSSEKTLSMLCNVDYATQRTRLVHFNFT